MEFQPADPEWIRKMLEGRKSVLEQLSKEDDAHYASKSCPSCGAAMYPVVDSNNPFVPGRITPKCLLQCTYCKTMIEPDTGIIVKTGEAYEPVPTVADLFIGEPDR